MNIAGVEVGDVTEVELENGRAVVDDGDRGGVRAADPRRRDDAAAPADRAPGHDGRGRPGHRGRAGRRGHDRPARPRPSRTSSPTRSSPRSTATPASTSSCCSPAAPRGIGGRGRELSAGLRRFEPLARDLARINGGLAERREQHRQRDHQLPRRQRGARRQRHPPGRSSSPPRTRSSTPSPTSRRRCARRCGAAADACGRRAARWSRATSWRSSSGPASRALIPAARAFAPAQRGAAPVPARHRGADPRPDPPLQPPGRSRCSSTSRAPRSRSARRPRGWRARSATSTSSSTPSPTTRPAPEEGYLFWLAWLNHNTNNIFLDPGRARPAAPRARAPVVLRPPASPRASPRTRPFLRTLQQITQRPRVDHDLPPGPGLMETRPPTITRILIAVGFAISCFGLALFLWLAFGGPIPLKPEGYRFQVPFDEATQLAAESDVRISGVSVGKVKGDRPLRRGPAPRRRSSSRSATRRSPRTPGRSCARRRCSARPTSS